VRGARIGFFPAAIFRRPSVMDSYSTNGYFFPAAEHPLPVPRVERLEERCYVIRRFPPPYNMMLQRREPYPTLISLPKPPWHRILVRALFFSRLKPHKPPFRTSVTFKPPAHFGPSAVPIYPDRGQWAPRCLKLGHRFDVPPPLFYPHITPIFLV